MRVLLTNDDGIDAPGIEALGKAVSSAAATWVFAPAEEQSGCSHRATTGEPIRVEPRGERRFAIHGTPADCVRVAVSRYRGEFDYVLAGINSGGNLGADVFHSGTVAAVREAALHGVPGIAISHYRSRPLDAADWRRAAEWAGPLIRDLMERGWGPDTLWNINLPCLEPGAARPETVDCPLDLSPLPLEYREEQDCLHYAGEYHARERRPGSDVDVCFGGRIALTRLRLA